MTFGEWLRDQLYDRHLSAHCLATSCRISERTVQAWLNGERHPSFKQLVRINQAVGGLWHNPIHEWSEHLR